MPVPPVPPHPPGYGGYLDKPPPPLPPRPPSYHLSPPLHPSTPLLAPRAHRLDPNLPANVRRVFECYLHVSLITLFFILHVQTDAARTLDNQATAFHQPPYRGLSHGPPQQPPPNYNPPGFPEVTAHQVSSHPKTRMLRPLPRRNPSPCVTISPIAFVSPPGSLPSAVPDTPSQSARSNSPAAPHALEVQYCSASSTPTLSTHWDGFPDHPSPHHPVTHDRLPHRTVSQP
jgi:hypothetical protein